MNQHFLNGVSKYQQKILKKTVDLGLDFINGKARNNKVINYKTPLEIKLLMDQPIPLSSQKYSESIKILETIGKYSISQSDLNYIAFPDSGNSLAGMMGEIYSKFLNQNLVAYDRSAPIATIIEIQLIEWLRQLIGYDYKKISEINNLSEVSGMWTTGGHMSNHIAILTALNHKYPTLKTSGLPSLSITPKIVVAGNISHYSIASAAHHLGLGNDCLINCLSNPDFTTNCDDLIQILESRQKQNDVFLVIGVAGNTRTSSIDNLKKIAQICSRFGVWFHVDACHGGSLLFSPKLKRLFLDGIELADSVSLDPHKGMF
ncbi:MAG: pyridoxal-dependent decarboxylase, partial [Candidatus Shapirobacteria bacterium]